MDFEAFYNELERDLPTSGDRERKRWASIIVEEALDLIALSELLRNDKTVALRFQWLLSDVGTTDQKTLHNALPYLFSVRKEIKHIDFEQAFATYWMIVGVPEENEAEALDLLFAWVRSAHTNVTTKLRALKALLVLTEKYPELQNELRLSLEGQLDQYPENFRRKAEGVLQQLNAS